MDNNFTVIPLFYESCFEIFGLSPNNISLTYQILEIVKSNPLQHQCSFLGEFNKNEKSLAIFLIYGKYVF